MALFKCKMCGGDLEIIERSTSGIMLMACLLLGNCKITLQNNNNHLVLID